MKDLNTSKDLIDIIPLTVEITQKHLDKGDKDSPFADPLALAIIDSLKKLLTPNSFKDVRILSGVNWATIKVNKNFQQILAITKDNKNISVREIITPMTVILKETEFKS